MGCHHRVMPLLGVAISGLIVGVVNMCLESVILSLMADHRVIYPCLIWKWRSEMGKGDGDAAGHFREMVPRNGLSPRMRLGWSKSQESGRLGKLLKGWLMG